VKSFTREGLTFDVTDSGPTEGRLVVLLHGFPEDRQCWDQIGRSLSDAGYRVLAPDQRGYSPGARPAGRRAYALPELSADILALADTAGAATFDVVGHDWGGVVAWDLAARHPDRIKTCASLSTPHPGSVRDVVFKSTQLLHSWYMLFFQLPKVPELVTKSVGEERAARQLEKDGLDPDTAARYAARLADPAAIVGPFNWYRAIPYSFRDPIPDVAVPTLYVWSDGDRYLTRAAAEATARHVVAPYRFEILTGMSHWLPTGAPERVAPLLLEHLAASDI
jgi:pimeloyl-ACP methyl ester carboxylesterase